jgi:hypothetical protein
MRAVSAAQTTISPLNVDSAAADARENPDTHLTCVVDARSKFNTEGKSMPCLQSVARSLAVSVVICFAAFGQCQEASSPKLRPEEKVVPLYQYLEGMGVLFDCYFTIEQMPLKDDNWITIHDVKVGNEPSSIDKLVKQLSTQLKGVHVYRSKDNPAIIHFVDERLEKKKEYSLPKRVAFRFRGTPDQLVDKLCSQFQEFIFSQRQFLVGGWPPLGTDSSTEIHCSTAGASIRRILTDWIPLSQYERILWIADSRQIDGRLETDVQYLGPRGDGPVSLFTSKNDQEKRDVIDYLSGVPKVNGVISFKYGEVAYFNNFDSDKEEGARQSYLAGNHLHRRTPARG